VQSICDYLASPNGTVEIYDNKNGCYNQEQVEAACETVSVEAVSLTEQLSIHPNPFTTSISIEYELQQAENVQILIYNHLGEVVDVIMENQSSGKQQLIWDANGLPSGMYYYQVQIGNKRARGKMVKLGD